MFAQTAIAADFAAPKSLITRAIEALRRRLALNAAERELMSLDDCELAELRIPRGQIRAYVRGAVRH